MVLKLGKHKKKDTLPEEESVTPTDIDKLSISQLDPAEKGQFKEFKEFLKTVISFTGDLSSLTCPAFFLNGLSLLEYGTYWGDHPSTFTAISESVLPEDRLLAISRWFISTLYGSYASRCTDGKYEKKPYNPILGEQFFCAMGNCKCVCEQVCHHPPISAFYLEDEKAGVSLNGHSGQKSKFKGTSIKIEQVGRAILYLKKYDEQYMIDFPDLLIRGVLTGGAYIELGGSCSIEGSNGSRAIIQFTPKPWFGGEYNHIKGAIYSGGKLHYSLSGRWSHQSFFCKGEKGTNELLFDATSEPMSQRVTPPLSEQNEYESHKVWGPVTDALNQKNFKAANHHKSEIESWQRNVRKEREMKNEIWKPKLFVFDDDKDITNGDVYQKRVADLMKNRDTTHNLDSGVWTYKNALHLRK
ncbi:hypothetical protein BDB01DRAFT_833038 [Pilobolus umbonatus]|nr:hypothetical protein BDB01DRAFT_833038 [Pilobolus umbonatus]